MAIVVSTPLVHCGGIFTKLHLSLAALQAFAQPKRNNLLGVTVESAALLGVDELVPVRVVSIGSSVAVFFNQCLRMPLPQISSFS
jgi:hypothetical protein